MKSDDADADVEELYEQAPCALLSTLPGGLIVRANQTFLDWIGRSRESVLGTTRFQELLTMGSRMYYETHYSPLLAMQGSVSEIALEVRRKDGAASPVVASARQVRGADGAVRVVRVALFDSTDRRQYERELLLARQRAELATRELAEADVRRNHFIATLAHELRSPLAPIRSAVEVLRRSGGAGDTAAKTLPIMERQVTQIGRLVEDLLDVGRIGRDALTLHRVPVDLVSVVHHAVETSEPLLRDAGVALVLRLPETPIYVEADAARLAQAISNLLGNASKFTPRDGTATLFLERDGEGALLRVADTGIGIEEEQLSRIFEMFAQAAPEEQRRNGLGIGLTLARSLVERHDGVLTVHSPGLGQGTEFRIRLPVLRETLESVSRSFPPPEIEAPSASRRVLIVDDNHDSAQMMALLLGLWGHETRMAHDGLEAVAVAESFAPHLVLLDIGLPRLNGYEVAQRIRLQGGRPVLVALTGWGEEEDRRRSAAAGFDQHLVKPIAHDALQKLVAGLPDPA